MRWPPVTLHRRDAVLVDDVGDAAQLGRRGLPAPHARDHRIGAVALDVGVGALVDEARLRIVLRLARPGGDQVVVERRAAGRAAVGGAPFHERHHLRDRQELVLADRRAHLLVRVVGAAAHRLGLRRGGIIAARGDRQDLLDQPGARTARSGRLGVLPHVLQREQALLADRLDDVALAHAVAAAHLHVVGHGRGAVDALVAEVAAVVLAEHQMVAQFADVLAVAQQREIPGAVDGVADTSRRRPACRP